MKTILIGIITFLLATSLQACNPQAEEPQPPPPPVEKPSDDDNNDPDIEPNVSNKIRIVIGPTVYTATLIENATTALFKKMLPITVDMSDMNNNEKYCYLSGGSLPSSAIEIGTIRNGDLMLYGSNGLVLFYKTFPTSYRYTRLGAIDNPASLESTLGRGNVTIRFEQIIK